MPFITALGRSIELWFSSCWFTATELSWFFDHVPCVSHSMSGVSNHALLTQCRGAQTKARRPQFACCPSNTKLDCGTAAKHAAARGNKGGVYPSAPHSRCLLVSNCCNDMAQTATRHCCGSLWQEAEFYDLLSYPQAVTLRASPGRVSAAPFFAADPVTAGAHREGRDLAPGGSRC